MFLRIVLWLMTALLGLTCLLFSTAAIALFAQSKLGPGITGLVMGVLAGVCAWLLARAAIRLKRKSLTPDPKPETGERGNSFNTMPAPAGHDEAVSPDAWTIFPGEPTTAVPPNHLVRSGVDELDQASDTKTKVGARSTPVAADKRNRGVRRSAKAALTFGYAEHGGKFQHHGPYAVIDVETTGRVADGTDRIVEVAVVLTDATGRVLDEWATLINPERDTGPVHVHGISQAAVEHAPMFRDIADELLARLHGAVIVAHNASFDERFLSTEFARAGYSGLAMPAICTLWLSKQTLAAPNYRLETLAQTYGIEAPAAHSALGDARTVAKLLSILLEAGKAPLTFPNDVFAYTGPADRSTRVVTRAAGLRKGEEGWMANLLERLPHTAAEPSHDTELRYLEALEEAMSDGKLIGQEAKQLSKIVGQAGLGARQVWELNRLYLEGLRASVLTDEAILDPEQLDDLERVARMVGVEGYFDDLSANAPHPADNGAQPEVHEAAPAPSVASDPLEKSAKPRRCGLCGQPGHNRRTCPHLAT